MTAPDASALPASARSLAASAEPASEELRRLARDIRAADHRSTTLSAEVVAETLMQLGWTHSGRLAVLEKVAAAARAFYDGDNDGRPLGIALDEWERAESESPPASQEVPE